MNKTLTTLDIIAITKWYQDIQNKDPKPLSELPIKVQWSIKKNMKKIEPISQNFFAFREEAENTLRQEYIGDDKSEETFDEGQQQNVRRVKAEYLEEYQSRVNELNQKLTEIVAETNEINFEIINLDAIVEESGDKFINLTIEDLDSLSFMSE